MNEQLTFSLICEWSGSALGMLGAFLLARNTRISPYGWVAFLAANVAMIGWAWSIQAIPYLLQQIVFTATSLLGIYRSGLLNKMLNRGIKR